MSKPYRYLGVISLVGVCLLLAVTFPYGVGISPDSVHYLTAAENFSNQGILFSSVVHWNSRHFVLPLTHWPPLFAVVNAAAHRMGIGLLSTAWILNLLLFGVNAFLLGSIVFDQTKSSRLSCFAACLFLLFEPAYHTHAYAWSEPLFITMVLVTFIALTKHLSTDSIPWLMAAAVAASLGWFTRYSGYSLVMTAVIAILVFGKKSWLKRLLGAAFFAVIAAIPISWWCLRNMKWIGKPVGDWGGETARGAVFYEDIWAMLRIMGSWFFPFLPAALATCLLLVLFVIIFSPMFLRKNNAESDWLSVHLVWPLYILLHLISLVVLSSLFSLYITFDSRLLSPLFPPLLITLIYAVNLKKDWWTSVLPSRYQVVVLGAIFLPLLVTAIAWGISSFQKGLPGFSAQVWHESETLTWLREQPDKRVLFSPGHDALVLLTDYDTRNMISLSQKSVIAQFFEIVKRQRGLIVFLKNIDRPDFYSEAELLATGMIVKTRSFSDGAVYELKPHLP